MGHGRVVLVIGGGLLYQRVRGASDGDGDIGWNEAGRAGGTLIVYQATFENNGGIVKLPSDSLRQPKRILKWGERLKDTRVYSKRWRMKSGMFPVEVSVNGNGENR